MFTIADVIGIKLISNKCLLAGIGNKLIHYFNNEHGETISKNITLNFKNKIIGIHSKPIDASNEKHFVIVYGGRELVIFQLVRNELKIVQNIEFNDFISNVCLYNCDQNELESFEFSVLSSHSVAYRFGTKSDNKKHWQILNRAACADKSTLYSSFLLGEQWSDTICFGGTAFGDLFIWAIRNECNFCEVLQRITCHNGVIFSIDCSLSHNILTTSSDDRSVKIWNMVFSEGEEDNWKKCSLTSKKSLFGHTARIFRHKIIEYDNQPYIISIGEDSNVCIWSVAGKLLHRQSVSDGATLWNLDYDAEKSCVLISTSDGNIIQLFIDRVLNNTLYSVRCLCNDNSSVSCFESNENFSKIQIMSHHAFIIGLTDKNKLYYQTVNDGITNDKWTHIDQLLNNKQKIILLEIKNNLVAVASFQTVAIARWIEDTQSFHRIFHSQLSERLIRSIKFTRSNEIIVCNDIGFCQLLSLDTNSVTKTLNCTLPACKERWITAALRHNENLLLSDRCGNLHLYSLNDESEEIKFHHTLKNVHGYMGCNTINLEEQFNGADDEVLISTSGHDGTIKLISINNAEYKLKIIFTQKIPILWSDKIVPFQGDSTDRLIAGFNAKYFVCWHQKTNFLFEYECGGGHRFWDLYVDFSNYLCRFYFLRHKKIHEITFALPNHQLQPPLFAINKCNWHTKSCNVVECISTSGTDLLFISGGDDNLLKLNKLFNGKHDLSSMQFPMHLYDITSHISNITAMVSMKQINAKNESYLIFSAGGRAQICVTQIQIFANHAPARIDELCNFMLRGDMMTRKQQNIIFDPETKFTSLCIHKADDSDELFLIVGCSDGYIRQFNYIDNKINLLDTLFYGRCILSVFRFKWKAINYLVTMATDGKICFWSLKDFSCNSIPLFELRHHDSGINSFDFIRLDDSKFFIATGGDDQAANISELTLDNNTVSVVNTRKFPYEHTAQVNGVKFCADNLCLYTFSVDQVICCIDLKTFSVRKVARSCISDAKGLQVINHNRIFVYGCGAELINID